MQSRRSTSSDRSSTTEAVDLAAFLGPEVAQWLVEMTSPNTPVATPADASGPPADDVRSDSDMSSPSIDHLTLTLSDPAVVLPDVDQEGQDDENAALNGAMQGFLHLINQMEGGAVDTSLAISRLLSVADVTPADGRDQPASSGQLGRFNIEDAPPSDEELQARNVEFAARIKSMMEKLETIIRNNSPSRKKTWAVNILHVFVRHYAFADFSIFIRELIGHGAALLAANASEETKAAGAGALMGGVALANLAALAYHQVAGSQTKETKKGLLANFALMTASVAVAASTKTLGPMLPITAKAIATGLIRDMGFNLLFPLDNNQGDLRTSNFASMTADAIVYATSFLQPTAQQYFDQIYSGNDSRVLGLGWASAARNAVAFASSFAVPEFGNGISFPVFTSLLGTVANNEHYQEAIENGDAGLANLRLTMKMVKPTLTDAARQASSIMMARIVYITAINALLGAIALGITPERTGRSQTDVNWILNAVDSLLCIIAYYPWIWACMMGPAANTAQERDGRDEEEGRVGSRA